ncbi:hypothetical protein HDG32_002935 [Paraburkholderia sp. CI2]|uniref:hypothetical protein n=1 Tax=Paraburkholderia sp. CI2 TaxID=2723093 RepID=UPI00161470F0|nr:hypothetical protein [Paraburkholderia sp. CI2]MBB5466817.1 hypothetical protein [Paraburkholderia sp. CI2]
MKAIIERQLQRPEFFVPLASLSWLMISSDFNLGKIALVLAFRGGRNLLHVLTR